MFPLHRAWVQSLVRELRCRIPCGGAKKTRISGTRGAWQAACFPFRVGISPPHWSQASGWAGAQKAPPPAWDPSDHPIPFPDVQQIAERVAGGDPGGGEADTTSGGREQCCKEFSINCAPDASQGQKLP